MPCSLTVRNRSPRLVNALWINFDGDEERFATILPGHVWTVNTFETHPWRFRDARTGSLVCEYVAQRGSRLLQLYDDPANLIDGSDQGPASRSDGGTRGGGLRADQSGGSASAASSRSSGDSTDGDVGLSSSSSLDRAGLQRMQQQPHLRSADLGMDSPLDGPDGAGGAGLTRQGPERAQEQVEEEEGREQQRRRRARRREDLRADDPSAYPTATSNNGSVGGRRAGGATRPVQRDYAGRDSLSSSSAPSQSPPDGPGLAGGFDGLGNPPELYTPAQLLSVAVLPREEQAVVVLGLGGYEHPLSLLVGVPEARQVVNAAGAARGRRPTLLATWTRTLQALGGTLERVVITRQVDGIFYARIVLSQPRPGSATGPSSSSSSLPPASAPGRSGSLVVPGRSGPVYLPPGAGAAEATGTGGPSGDPRVMIVSVDSRPSDALALALEAGADVFVSLPVAELVQQQYRDAVKDLPERLLPQPEDSAGLLGAPSA